MSNIQLFKEQIVIVTGASRGIGRGIARLFAQEGAELVLVGREEKGLKKTEKELQHQGAKTLCVPGDVSSQKDMEKMVEMAMDYFGKIDVLCHNAGIYPQARLETMTLEEWQEVIDVNLTGTFLAVKSVIPNMKKRKQGKIVVTSSISGPIVGLPGFSHYTASKGGVAGFIRTAAVELAKYNINVNAVEPGNILTESFEALGDDFINDIIRSIPLSRLGTPDDVARAVLFLASKAANFITGQSIIIDGGQTLPKSHFLEY